MRKLIKLAGFTALFVMLLPCRDAFAQGGGRGGGGGGGDPGRFFDRIAQGKSVINISDVQRPAWLAGPLSQYAQEKGLAGGQLSREQFADFMEWMKTQRAGQKGGQQPGGQGAGGRAGMDVNNPDTVKRMAEKMFQRMDHNKDGRLTPDEVPAIQQEELFKFDKNGDGAIDFEEFTAYMQAKMHAGSAHAPDQKWEVETVTPEGEIHRPTVFRAGKLPKGLPSWFEKYDTDKDGQVSLYEWRMAKKDLKEFKEMDRNDDGLLTVEEVLRYEQLAKANSPGTRPTGTQTASIGEGPPAMAAGSFPGMGRKGPRFRQP